MRRARIYAKKLFDTTYADKGEHLTKNAYYQSFLNALDTGQTKKNRVCRFLI